MAHYGRFFASLVLGLSIVPHAYADTSAGAIHVGRWVGGPFKSEKSGAFSHCGAVQTYGDGRALTVAESANGLWLVGFTDPSLKPSKGTFPLSIIFDGQAPIHVAGAASASGLVMAIIPEPAVQRLRKSHLIAFQGTTRTVEFALSSNDSVVTAIDNCVTRMSGGGAGEFSTAKKNRSSTKQAKAEAETPTEPAGPPHLVHVNGTGFLVSKEGHVVTNNHVIKGCVSDVQGNFVGQPAKKMRIVATDETNDLALLQAKGAKKLFKEPAMIRETPVQSGDQVVAIGFPYHGLLTSDFTVTTGIISSLSGILNDTRFLQISAPVQPGNSGGPLLDMSGHVIGVVSSRLNALKIAKATGDIPQNINFAIKTGTVKDFLDNSVVPYGTKQSEDDLKPADIASAARTYIMLITCTASESEPGKD